MTYLRRWRSGRSRLASATFPSCASERHASNSFASGRASPPRCRLWLEYWKCLLYCCWAWTCNHGDLRTILEFALDLFKSRRAYSKRWEQIDRRLPRHERIRPCCFRRRRICSKCTCWIYSFATLPSAPWVWEARGTSPSRRLDSASPACTRVPCRRKAPCRGAGCIFCRRLRRTFLPG